MIKKYILVGVPVVILIVLNTLSVKTNKKLKLENSVLNEYTSELEFYKLRAKADSLLNQDEFDEALILYTQMDSITNSDEYSQYASKIYEERNRFSKNYSKLYNNLRKRSGQIKKLSDNKKELNDSLENIKSTLGVLQEEFDSILAYNSNIALQVNQLNDSINSIKTNDTLSIVNADGVNIKYLGETKDGKASGYGYAIFDNKSYYEGQWDNNLRSGNGKYFWQNGDFYDGEYSNGMRSGFGTYHFESGERYIGNWKNDLRHGNGVLLDKDGKQLYKGLWKDNKPSKKG
ncbi:MORN repeat-containing protein [Saccharicrinis aurantiacus]|uniref:MORN repeat-containing protein n=1 Tax=Saccharicrinis aurantiacus TaxID=1849719 RepID=UPI000837BA77|nr:hypothetical protein [Saccharicrinis aurantiacus]